MDRRVAARIERLLGARVRRVDAVHGGDNSAAHRVQLEDGRVVFAKTHASPPAGWFTTEATGLEWLRAAQAVRVPEVLAVSDGNQEAPAHLVMEWIEEGGRGAADEASFGRALADLHRAGAPSYGREDRRTTGSRRLPNDPSATWPEFYATRRLLPLAERHRAQGGFKPLSATESGIRVFGEQRAAAVSDFDGDGRVNLAVTQNGAETKLYHNAGAKPGLRVRLRGLAGNPDGVGACIRLVHGENMGPAREIHAGSGYWSQDGAVQVLAGGLPARVWTRWPGGRRSMSWKCRPARAKWQSPRMERQHL